jgi:hypothetical protein
MQVDKSYYFEQLYPLQDSVLQVINSQETGFHLTGGTVVSRVYLQHRVSADLDLFVNFNSQFVEWSAQIIDSLAQSTQWQVQVTLRQQYFARLLLTEDTVTLKVEMINDVPSHIGALRHHPVLGRIDSPENILAGCWHVSTPSCLKRCYGYYVTRTSTVTFFVAYYSAFQM